MPVQVRRVVGSVLSLESNDEIAFIVLETAQSDRVYFKCGLHTHGYPPMVGEVIGVSYVVDQGELRITDIDRTPNQYRHTQAQDRGSMTRTYDEGLFEPQHKPRARDGVRPDGISVIVAINLMLAALSGFGSILFSLFPLLAPLGGVLLLIAGGAVVLSYGLWMYEEWARVGMMVLAAIGCLTIIGIFIGLPVIWYLNTDKIKRIYGGVPQSRSTYHDW